MTRKQTLKLSQLLKNSIKNIPFPDSSQIYWLWRSYFVTKGKVQSESGFILPMVTLLLLMVALVVGTLVYRSFSRTNQVFGERRQEILYNSATPAVDRGKLKLEYLFAFDNLPPLPSDLDITNALRNDGLYLFLQNNDLTSPQSEKRIDLNGDGTVDNAWVYESPAGDRVIYSILGSANAPEVYADPNNNGIRDPGENTLLNPAVDLTDPDATKADRLLVRNGPLNLKGASTKPNCDNIALSPIAGWSPSSDSSTLLKALQVHSVVVNDQRDYATLEMQQDRQASLGNKWGAWFRYDLEISPGPNYRWNGAMHTEGSYFITGSADRIKLHLISDPDSCVYTRSNSEITMAEIDENNDGVVDYQGQFVTGKVFNNSTDGEFVTDIYQEDGPGNDDKLVIKKDSGDQRDSINNAAAGATPAELSLNPITVLAEDRNETLRDYGAGDYSATTSRDTGNWDDTKTIADGDTDDAVNRLITEQRVFNARVVKPFVDDTYRADDRWGPKPKFGTNNRLIWSEDLASNGGVDLNKDGNADVGNGVLDSGEDTNNNGIIDSSGYPIDSRSASSSEITELTQALPDDENDEETYGYDGYWERRATKQGLRLIVSERLELGNRFGWVNEDKDGDGTVLSPDTAEDNNRNGELDRDALYPLYPPEANAAASSSMADRAHESKQWRSLRDNLAAVQSMAVYHYLKDDGEFPVACMANTEHSGTTKTRADSTTFQYVDTDGNGSLDTLNTDFLTGQGTNGMEFSAPFGGNLSTFKTQVNDSNSPLRLALANLAYFAGDPAGGFTPMQDTNDGNNANDAANLINLNITEKFTPGTGQTFATTRPRYAGNADNTIGHVVHPYPYLTMWGNYSNLRRIVDILNTNEDRDGDGIRDDVGEPDFDKDNVLDRVTYDDLSLSDQTTLQTSTCTLGMLAYNVSVKQNQYNANEPVASRNVSLLTSIPPFAAYVESKIGLSTSVDINNDDKTKITLTNPTAFTTTTCPTAFSFTSSGTAATAKSDYEDIDLSQWICSYARVNTLSESATETLITELNTLLTINLPTEYNDNGDFFRSNRDRVNGFVPGLFEGKEVNSVPLQLQCESQMLLDSTNLPGGTIAEDTDQAAALALAICPQLATTNRPQPYYPALYYVFPIANHDHGGLFSSALTSTTLISAGGSQVNQTTTSEPYVDRVLNPYIFDRANTRGVNHVDFDGDGNIDTLFRPVEDGLGGCAAVGCAKSTANDVVDGTETIANFVTYLGITPQTTASNWQTPLQVEGSTSGDTRRNTICMGATTTPVGGAYDTDCADTGEVDWHPGFLDKGFFNGREWMAVRNLDIDLDLMRRSLYGGTTFPPNSLDASPSVLPANVTSDYWLPLPKLVPFPNETRTGALIYAFREDAMREDGIARPRSVSPNYTTWRNNWRAYVNLFNNTRGNYSATFPTGYLMNGVGTPNDPPVSPYNLLSAKPVDYYTDPDRRPHGFRLRNGDDLRRLDNNASDGSNFVETDLRGMTFVTDNVAYTVGHFNRHVKSSDATEASFEEFTQAIGDDFENIYNRSTLNSNSNCAYATPCFANIGDRWRPTEILADAVTILSENYNIQGTSAFGDTDRRNGTIAEGITKVTNNSFSGLNYPNDLLSWVREDGTRYDDSTGLFMPIKISRRGFPVYCVDTGTTTTSAAALGDNGTQCDRTQAASREQEYGRESTFTAAAATPGYTDPVGTVNYYRTNGGVNRSFDDYNTGGVSQINDSDPSSISYVMVSGMVPPRRNQGYGGLHNFPRFNEDWGGDDLFIRGSIIQLNFSNSATGNFEQDAWEPGWLPPSSESIRFYSPPSRRWGYDVALQYASAGPVARRFVVRGGQRSEYYREVASDDPYITNLLCAQIDNNRDNSITASDLPATDQNEDGVVNAKDNQADPKASCP